MIMQPLSVKHRIKHCTEEMQKVQLRSKCVLKCIDALLCYIKCVQSPCAKAQDWSSSCRFILLTQPVSKRTSHAGNGRHLMLSTLVPALESQLFCSLSQHVMLRNVIFHECVALLWVQCGLLLTAVLEGEKHWLAPSNVSACTYYLLVQCRSFNLDINFILSLFENCVIVFASYIATFLFIRLIVMEKNNNFVKGQFCIDINI